MYKVPLAEIKVKIINHGALTAEQLEQRIKTKINELSGLISEEGAAHIIANELGITILPPTGAKLKVKEIYSGMRHVSAVGRVVKKYELREFTKNDSTGKVASCIIADETGAIRLVLWNDQAEQIREVRENDIILVKEAYVKEANNGKELHIGEKGELVINPEGETINTVRSNLILERRKIKELLPGEERVEILGIVSRVFNPTFFQVCPTCNKRLAKTEEAVQCKEHGIVTPQLSYVLNAVVEDESGDIRCTFWKNQTLRLLEQVEEEVILYKDNLSAFEERKKDLEGEQLKLVGRVQKNEMFNRLEFNVQLVEKANPEEELARLEKMPGEKV